MTQEETVYQIKVTLLDSEPEIWRRVQLSGDTDLENLHLVLQVVMDWEDYHMHRFVVGEKVLGVDEDFMPDPEGERRVTLRELVHRPGDRIFYEYDFGDGWEHEVLIEALMPPRSDLGYPFLVEGDCAAPPEDCGGIPGYYMMLEIIEDEEHPDHDEMLQWLGGDFDPIALDQERINRNLRSIG